ncbi:DUF3558 family protein [Nocardia veterana]|uniref:DUF3558 family protein n=1 Tax=Nocardia veterana TaxID=132249 RepID=A0A7X6RHP1_9NOCA|nr:DUF3558 family protein [Nocardia veterana]NKY86407.1 DUF3558 family protein [Nocardia veterana]
MKLGPIAMATACAAAAFLAGCSSDGTATPAASPTAAGPATSSAAAATATTNTKWNPCSIPDADIAAAGLNPAKRHTDTDKYAVKFPGWDVCAWDSGNWIRLQVFSTNTHTFDEVRNNTVLFNNPRTVSIGGRDAVMMGRNAIPDGCVVAFDVPGNPVTFEINPSLAADSTGDACAELTRIATVLVKDLPSGK